MWLGEASLLDDNVGLDEFQKLRDLVHAHGWTRCAQRRAYWIGDTRHIPDDDNIYRVKLCPDTGHAHVSCLGLESVDSTVDGNYNTVNELPAWMKEKLTLLSMLTATPPTEPVEGVGRRINTDTYWVFC